MKKLATYINGNTYTIIYEDGTKTHFTMDDEFNFAFPESHDISISQCCDNGCEWCYYGCTPSGKFGKLDDWKFFDTMRPYTEIAINIQRPTHPHIAKFLQEMNNRKIIVNITINQNHFMDENFWSKFDLYIKLGWIKGVGISLTNPSQDGFIEKVKKYSNAVIHVIAGITKPEDIKYLMGHGIKILILGYKGVGRGERYEVVHYSSISDNIKWFENNVYAMIDGFKVVSFDNLAIEQLHVKDKLSKDEWDMFYGGDDGTLTFFIDLVEGIFARNSLSQIAYPIGDKTIDEMFAIIKNEVKSEKQELS